MSQTRRKRKERGAAESIAAVQNALNLPEVLEALAGEALASEREEKQADAERVEQEALIAATQESEARPDTAFQLRRVVESLLFASDRPLTIANIRQYVGGDIARKDIQESLDALVEEYSERGIVLHDVAGGYQFRTHPASSEWIQKLIAGRPVRLSRAQLDTLAIIAYRQPITRPEIDDIRGVDSGSTLRVLLDRSMIRILGKKEEVGRPLLYGTSKEFLEFFNLAELRDLPTLREFHELNDEGMAEVDKLGADIRGVDVGAVAAQVAAEKEAEAIAALERAEEEAEAKRQAKEAEKEARIAAQAEAAKYDPDSPLVMPKSRGAEVAESEAVEAAEALAGSEQGDREFSSFEDVVASYAGVEGDVEDPVKEDEIMANGDEGSEVSNDETVVEQPPGDPDTMMEEDAASTLTSMSPAVGETFASVDRTIAEHEPPQPSDTEDMSELAEFVASERARQNAASGADSDGELEEQTVVGGFVGEDTAISDEPSDDETL